MGKNPNFRFVFGSCSLTIRFGSVRVLSTFKKLGSCSVKSYINVGFRFCSGSSSIELETCFHGGHLLRIN